MGHWEEKKTPWYDQTAVYCELSGMLIPRRYWVAEIEGRRHIFAGPEYEELYRTYRLGGEREAEKGGDAAQR
jgi:hypothetical protein